MKKYAPVLFLIFICRLSIAQQISLEDIWINYTYYPKNFEAQWLTDTSYVAYSKGLLIAEHPETGKKDTLLKTNNVPDLPEPERLISASGNYALFESGEEKIYRHSTRGIVHLCHLPTAGCVQISDNKIRYPALDPENRYVVYVDENNLKAYDLIKKSTLSITADGKAGSIINGAADWVYEEEFGITSTYTFAAGENAVYYLKFDESQVREYELQFWGTDTYPRTERYKYPVAGEKNAKVSLWKYDFATGKNSCLLHPDSIHREFYIPRLFATGKAGEIGIFTLNRHQNSLHLLTFTGNGVDTVWHDSSDTYLEVFDAPVFIEGGSKFIYATEADGFKRFFIYNRALKQLRYLSPGNTEADELYGADTSSHQIYFTAASPNPTQRMLAATDYRSGERTIMQNAPGTHSANFSPGFKYYIHRYSSSGKPPVVTLVKTADNNRVKILESNSALINKNKQLHLSQKEFITIPVADNKLLNASIIRPHKFNPKKKYPVLVYVYGGPGYQLVKDEWDPFNFYWYQLLADKGFIILTVDPTGSGGRGRDFRDEGYPVLGQKETEDMIEVAKYLGRQSYVDKERIGIWGWSYGGYLSLLCLTAGADYYKAGIAVAPVTSWRFYDTIYTERFMKTPAENTKGYDENSPVMLADRLKGKLLLIHGTGDDNVHVRHSMAMQNALIENGKQFQSFFYPDKNHGIYGGNTRYHLYTMMTEFLEQNLKK